MIRIYHIADLHIGFRFQNHIEAQNTLIRARFETLGNLVDQANEKKSDVLAIAGGLLSDRLHVWLNGY